MTDPTTPADSLVLLPSRPKRKHTKHKPFKRTRPITLSLFVNNHEYEALNRLRIIEKQPFSLIIRNALHATYGICYTPPPKQPT